MNNSYVNQGHILILLYSEGKPNNVLNILETYCCMEKEKFELHGKEKGNSNGY